MNTVIKHERYQIKQTLQIKQLLFKILYNITINKTVSNTVTILTFSTGSHAHLKHITLTTLEIIKLLKI